jgi:hypothetical protein
MTHGIRSETKLRSLLAAGALPASECGKAFLKLVAPLLAGAVLAWQRSGAGRRLVVSDAQAFGDFCRQRFPNADLPPNAGSRVAGVGRFRDTKAMVNTGDEIISVRVWRDDALHKNGRPIAATTATATHGVFSFQFTRECPYELHGRCALVENPAVFAVADQLNLGVGLMLYGHGRISKRVIDWLVRMADSSFSLLHLPDYDPVGLSEFQRLHARLGDRVDLYLPADLEIRFANFSNQDLLRKKNSQAMLARLRRSETPAIRRVVELIDRNNAGLEQEALLLR